ncbi:phage tail protein [Pectobacterium aroidearum]|uniref:phage tail protein n=1 Tax=Pectobacterium aroidearum TaxID=1201031 RepID=UPI0030168468
MLFLVSGKLIMQNLMPPVNTPDNVFHDGNPLTGELGTIVTAKFMNDVQAAIRNSQAEIISILTDAGIAVDPNKTDQLLAALKTTFATNMNMNGRVPSTRKVNNKALSADITLAAGDVGALAKDQNGADIPDKPAFLSTLLYRGELADGGTFAACNQVGVYRVGINAANTVADAPKNIRGEYLYSYGFLLVEEVNNVINQTYIPHRGPIATRQNWDGAAYSLGWNVMLDGLTNKPTATDIGAFPLGFTGAVNNSDVAWNASSGIYQALFPDSSQMVVHFHGGGASCPSLQFLAEYGNSGLSYRTARDGVGFERPWAKFYTTQFKPTAADVGALPITGGALEGGIRIGAGNIDLPATRAVVGVMPDESYRQMLSLSPDNTVVIGSPNSSAVIHTTDRAYIAAAGGARHSIYHDGNLTTSTIGALPASELAGIPLPFPGAVAPAGWLKCNGQQFDTAQFPVLTSRYPSGFLPDLRGEFVRGWDDGRGADTGRALLSAQGDAIRNITGKFETADRQNYVPSGAFSDVTRNGAGISGNFVGVYHSEIDFDVSRVVPTANENRPRNIAFNYIVRAA